MATVTEVEAGASKICELLLGAKPFFVGRNGTIEVETVYSWAVHKLPYAPYVKEQLQRNAGVFPSTDSSINAWAAAYTKALSMLDTVAAGWYKPMEREEHMLLKLLAPNAVQHPLRSLEPYYVGAGERWTQHLAGKKVAVVSSFTKTIQSQLERINQVWTGDKAGLIPADVDWKFVQTGYAPILALGRGGWPEGVNTWQLAVNSIVERVIASGAKIVLVGCGGLGMVIGGRLRELGVSVILLGGAIQVLFGIKGKRWATHGVISHFWNESWVWPAAEEVPKGAELVEGGCYW
jgi:hypothetical protein